MPHGDANSAAMRQQGLPNGVGAILLVAVAVVPGACELKGIVKTLSFLDPPSSSFCLLWSATRPLRNRTASRPGRPPLTWAPVT